MKTVIYLSIVPMAFINCSSPPTISDAKPEKRNLPVTVEATPSVTIEETDSLTVYYPNFSRIDLVTGQMPDKLADTIGIP